MKLAAFLFLAVAACGGPAVFELSPIDPEDYAGPSIHACDPARGSYGIPVDYPLRVTFSARLAPATVFTGIRLTGPQGVVTATVALEADGRTVRLRGDWPADTPLTLVADANLTDTEGFALRDQDNHDAEPFTPFALAFTTGADRIDAALRVVASEPADGATGIPASIAPAIRFSKRIGAQEPAVTLLGPSGTVPHSTVWERGRTQLRIRPDRRLHEDTLYELRVEYARDAWGHALATPAISRFAVRKGGGRVLINEIVTAPLHDWGESAPGDGLPFNAVPGTGSITASDEWVELFNGSDAAVDLTDWTLEFLDGSNQTHAIGVPGNALELFTPASATASHFDAGGYLVVGNPAGDNADTVTVVLRDGYGLERDRVTLGSGAPRGDGVSAADEAVARVPNGADTGNDAVDWRRAKATPGQPN